MQTIAILGGRQRTLSATLPSASHTRHAEAVIVMMDVDTGECEQVVSYETPPEARPQQQSSIVFKSGTMDDGKLYVGTTTEAMVYDTSTWEMLRYVSLPCFNDVHHVRPTADGTLLVVSTGLDLVVEIDDDDRVVREWNTLEADTWDRFDRDTDYRKVLSTKPHRSHPNNVFIHDDEIWVSRFEQRDALCLTNRDRRIDIAVERPHDGHVVGDSVWFTTVDGHVVTADLRTDEVTGVYDLHSMDTSDEVVGWLRGLTIANDGDLLVGFSTLRVTKIRENIRWVKTRFGRMDNAKLKPTHIARFDVGKGNLKWRRPLDDPLVDVVFSVLG
ncbi:MAG: hypothetical protein GY708_04865 [Actinomycetia bacterium]|nr:hypothetical protein [Actinomycetes bacterium]MCP4962466.1 hypothetical protein [Actinomycetes bacterium]